MEIKNIVFDFGGVLIDWNPRHVYKDVFQDEKEMEFFLDNVCNMEWNVKQDAGRTFADATQELLIKFPHYEHEIRIYYERWKEMIGGPIEANVDLLKELKANYRLFGLTNWSAEAFPIIFKEYPFFKEFEGIVVSGTEKLIKPDPEIYKVLLFRYDLEAEESIFIDDNYDNVLAANALGFKSIHFHENVNLRHEIGNV